jgi:hypothetical protein
VHRLTREALRRRDRHLTSTSFQVGVIKRVNELFKRPKYIEAFWGDQPRRYGVKSNVSEAASASSIRRNSVMVRLG